MAGINQVTLGGYSHLGGGQQGGEMTFSRRLEHEESDDGTGDFLYIVGKVSFEELE